LIGRVAPVAAHQLGIPRGGLRRRLYGHRVSDECRRSTASADGGLQPRHAFGRLSMYHGTAWRGPEDRNPGAGLAIWFSTSTC